MPSSTNREAWLESALPALAAIIKRSTDLKLNPKKVRVSCGWPRSDRNGQVIGQCWTVAAGKGTSQLFISPLLHDPIQVLATLLHELIHAADDCSHSHAGPFVKAIRAVGLKGKPTATLCEPGSELETELKAIVKELGKYPHKGFDPADQPPVKKQSTRMIKCECDECGYTVRTTKKWLDVATPICPLEQCDNFQQSLTIEQKEDESE